jgi:hypothetical protein
MNSRIGLQILILLLVIGMWDFIALGNRQTIVEIDKSIGNTPVLLYSFDRSVLDRVASAARGQGFYLTHHIDAGEAMADDLIQRYGLQSSAPILKQYALPSLLRIYVKGDRFDYAAKDRFWRMIRTIDPSLVIDFNEDQWRTLVKQRTDANRSAEIFDIFGAFVFLLAASILRWIFEHRQREYWRVFIRSGGDWGKRRAAYFGQVCLMVPALLVFTAGAIFAAHYYWIQPGVLKLEPFLFYIRLLVLQGVGIILAQWIGYYGVRNA